MFTEEFIQSIVDNVVIFATDLLMPAMGVVFVAAVILRFLIYYTVKREYWFAKEFSKRVRKFMDAREENASQSFFVITKRLLEITYYEVFEIRSILKRRNPDAIMTLTDRIFLVQQGCARMVHDILSQIKFFKWGERPRFLELSNNVLRNNPCFTNVFGLIPVSPFNSFLNTLPGLFIVGGIFGTFLGIMKALPELGGMNLSDFDGSKLIMDNFLLKISFSMSTSIIGIIFSVAINLCNTFFSCEKAYVETVEHLESELELLWNMSSSNKLPREFANFDADRDPIEILSEGLIAKELNVKVGFLNLIWPVSKWWDKMGKTPTTGPTSLVAIENKDRDEVNKGKDENKEETADEKKAA